MENGTLTCAGSDMAITHEGSTYKVTLAPTVGGGAVKDAGELQLLQPDKKYKLAVCAYCNVGSLSIADPEAGTTQETNYKAYGPERLSELAEIKAYKPAEFTVKMNGEQLAANTETGMYEAVVSPTNKKLEVTVASTGDYKIDVTRETENPDAQDACHEASANLTYELGDFEGSATYDIVITNNTTKDRTLAFLQVSVDDVKPTLVMDADVFEADPAGDFTVSGTTNPGVKINDGDLVGADGRFQVSGDLREHYYLLKSKKVSFIANYVNQLNEHFDTEEEFNEFVAEQDAYGTWWQPNPATWSGSGDYDFAYGSSYEWLYTLDYTDEIYGALLAGQQDGSRVTFTDEEGYDRDFIGITKLATFDEEKEISQSDFVNYQQNGSQYQTVSEGDRVNGSLRTMTVTAADEIGNETKATVRIVPHTHEIVAVPETPATCSHEGTKAHFKCTKCGETFGDELGMTEASSLSIPKLAPASLSVGNIKVDKTTIPLKTKQKLAKISAKLASGDRLVAAKSSNVKVAKVSVKGDKLVIVAGKKTGTATITVKSKLDSTVTFKVKVQKKKVVAKKIVGFKKKVTLKKGQSYKVPKDVSPVSVPDKLKFKSSKKKVAAVSGAGVVKAKKPGKATITVTVGKKKFKCKVTVK